MRHHNRIVITTTDWDRLSEMLTRNGIRVRWRLFADTLQRAIAQARLVEPSCVPEDVVTMYSTVRIKDLDAGRVEIYTLVYPAESDLSAGRLSVLAPLGTALLGASAGDIVHVANASGPRALLVEEIIYQPEAEGAVQA